MKEAPEGHGQSRSLSKAKDRVQDVAQLHPAGDAALATVTGKKATTQAKADTQQTP